jgi:MarR family transcriptional regulator, 2-MHQ and catechol-resistance regulon repressor
MPTHFEGPENTRLALDTFIKLTRATNALEHTLFQAQKIPGLTATQFGVLETLYHLGPLCQGALSGKLLKSSGNVTLVLDNLEKQDLVKRIRQEDDRRMVMIELTSAGRKLIEEVFPMVSAEITRAFSGLSPQEQKTLAELTKKLGQSLSSTTSE